MAEPGSLQPSSSGIALVMVLGILSVMVIMAVAFAISMRTERVAAGNYADSVRARQLVQVGLARAMDDIAGKLGTNGLGSAVGGTNYPPWNVTNSYAANYVNHAANVYLVYATNSSTRANEVTNFVPRVLWTAAVNADSNSASNHWLPIESLIYTNDAGSRYLVESNRMGRVKYLVLNCSGLLDANWVGGMARGFGTNPAELAIGNMPEFANAAAFLTQRASPDYRYETLEELAALQPSSFNGFPSNFTVYSYAPAGYWDMIGNQGGTQVNLAGTEVILQKRYEQITNAFYQAGCTGSYYGSPAADILYSNLIDYVDDDSIPSNLECCVESVPMISKITCASVTGSAADKYNITVTFRLWYPFVTGGGAYSFDAQVRIGGVAGPIISIADPSVLLSAGQFKDISGQLTDAIVPGPYQPILESATVKSGSDILDGLKPSTLPFYFTNDAPAVVWECIDPRFNYYPANTLEWNTPVVSDQGAINGVTIKYWDNADVDQDAAMYVANRPFRVVGELGCLAYAPWKTIKLYGVNCQRVLDVFGISTNASYVFMTNTVYRGRVNCNSNSALDATAVVFADMPVDQYPGGPSNTVLMPDAQTFAATIFRKGAFTNISDIGRNLNSMDFQVPAGMNELQRESYFRNAFNLLNVRQNLFTIIIEAHVASGGNIPLHPVRQRAVALVWRDPYTGEMFVRSIKWLED